MRKHLRQVVVALMLTTGIGVCSIGCGSKGSAEETRDSSRDSQQTAPGLQSDPKAPAGPKALIDERNKQMPHKGQ